jgi:DNA-binding MarR family transcriptional regulator
MAPERLSRLQRRILAWLQAHEQQFKGTMSASHQNLARAMRADKSNLSHSLRNLEAKGVIRIMRTAGGKAEAMDLTPQGRKVAAQRTGSCE